MNALIIDDEPKNRSLLRKMLELFCPEVTVCGEGGDGKEGLIRIKETRPDVLFLDIKMPEVNGFEMLDMLHDFKGSVVFVTAYQEFAIQAIKYAAFDYLLKPIEPEELQKTVARLLEKSSGSSFHERLQVLEGQLRSLHKRPDKIPVPTLKGFDVLSVPSIVYLEADGAYTHFHLTDGLKVTSSKHLREFEDLLSTEDFFRCHHSYLVQLSHVQKFIRNDNLLYLTGSYQIEVSKRKKEEFMKRMKGVVS